MKIYNKPLATVSLKVASRKRRCKCTKSYDRFTKGRKS